MKTEGYIDYLDLRRDKNKLSIFIKWLWYPGGMEKWKDPNDQLAFMLLFCSIMSDDMMETGCTSDITNTIEEFGWDWETAHIIYSSMWEFINKHDNWLIIKRWLCEYNKEAIGKAIYREGVPEGTINYCD
jgi:hypothetical protein